MTVVLFSWGKSIEGGTAEALSFALDQAAERGAELRWAVMAELEHEALALAAHHGVRHVDVIETPAHDVDARVAVFAGYCRASSPDLILFNQSVEGRVIAARVAGRLGLPVLANVVALSSAGGSMKAEASAYGGDTRAEYVLSAPRNVLSVVTTGPPEFDSYARKPLFLLDHTFKNATTTAPTAPAPLVFLFLRHEAPRSVPC